MIWRRKDPAEDHFVKFGHQEARIDALESDLTAISNAMLAYIEESGVTAGATRELADILHMIVKNREAGEK